MKIVVIGGSGHIGSYLIPRLVEMGYETVNITRGKNKPYSSHPSWQSVQQVNMDRAREEAEGKFTEKVAALRPDIVMDLFCFTPDSARSMVEGLRGRIQHYISCGTIWVHGPGVVVPTTEDQARAPFGDYGIQKAAMEAYLLNEARLHGFPATVLHPGHIVGQGWPPLNPAGHFNPEAFEKIGNGEELILPNLGLETVHHVHADDVAQAFIKAMTHWRSSIGEAFHVTSPAALTLRGYAERMSAWFGLKSNLGFLPWEEWRKTVSEEDALYTWDHIAHSPSLNISKAVKFLEYQPRYSSIEAVYESVRWLMDNGVIHLYGNQHP